MIRRGSPRVRRKCGAIFFSGIGTMWWPVIRAYERSLGELRQLIQTGRCRRYREELERAKEEREKFPVRT